MGKEEEDKINDEDTTDKSLKATRGVTLYGLDPIPKWDPFDPHHKDSKIYKCPKCQKVLLAADILWKDPGNDTLVPFCDKCQTQVEDFNNKAS